MSRIDKLAIVGVRSFDHTRTETIQFHAPLTLIVGYNGSGKTTIIECLKYVTTGDLPPNSKGGAFIHDPKICGEKEVRAQVKLSFKNTSGAKMVCTRSLQLSVKKATRAQRTLDGQLTVHRNGERSAISSRCAELDMLMPQYLGVSKAVLDLVIFCHQDESLWPLSEPAALKKKFDEIFEALKYTKAIDNIKVLRKHQKEDLGKLALLVEQYRQDKDRGDKIMRRSMQLENELDLMRSKIQELGKTIAIISAQEKECIHKEVEWRNMMNELDMKKRDYKKTEGMVNQKAREITELQESDEELIKMKGDWKQRLQSYHKAIEEKGAELGSAESEEKLARTTLNSTYLEHGKLQEQKNIYEGQIQNRLKIIKETFVKHDITGFDSDLDDSLVDKFIQKLESLVKDQTVSFESAKQMNRNSYNAAIGQCNELVLASNDRKRAIDHAKNEIQLEKEKANTLQREIDKLERSGATAGQKSLLDDENEDLDRRLQAAKAEYEINDYDNQLRVYSSSLREARHRQAQINEEGLRCLQLASDRGKADHYKKDYEHKKKAKEIALLANKDRLDSILGPSWNSDDLQTDLQSVIILRDEEVEESRKMREDTKIKLSHIEAKIALTRSSLVEKQNEVKVCELAVMNSYGQTADAKGISGYLLAKKDLEERLENAKGERKAHLTYFRKALKAYDKHSNCLLCLRTFANLEEETKFSEKLRTTLQKLEQQAREEKLEDLEEDYRVLIDAGSKYDSYMRLMHEEIPRLHGELQEFDRSTKEIMANLNERDIDTNNRRSALGEAELLQTAAAEITKYTQEMSALEAQVNDLEISLSQSGASRGADELGDASRQVDNEVKELDRQYASLTAKKEAGKQALTSLDGQSRDVRSKLQELGHRLQKLRELADQILTCKSSIARNNNLVAGADKDLKDLIMKIDAANTKAQQMAREGREREDKQEEIKRKLEGSKSKLEDVQKTLLQFTNRGVLQQLGDSEEKINEAVRNLERKENSVKSLKTEIDYMNTGLHNADKTNESISRNLLYRKDKRELQTLESDIRELEEKNAEEKHNDFVIERNRLERQCQKQRNEKSTLEGEAKSKDDELLRNTEDWNVNFKGAKRLYLETVAKQNTLKAAYDDLAKYSQALDQAIMRYHSIKMEEINRIVDELWKATYRGTDVDTILIRSEGENAKGNRSYNYRVVMMKQDAELDMRGRCSAGQKVLASIIIRLALAECFGVNCGLIALDEPTTNLDNDNIRSLARSLHEIIRYRQAQSNFQLIVITHDEEFLKEMNCQDYCDHYYRVSRNDRQKSIIERQSIAEVV